MVFWVLKASIDDYTTGMQADGGAFRGSMCIVGCGFPWQHWPHLLITYGNGNMRFSTTWQSDHSKDIIYIYIYACVSHGCSRNIEIYTCNSIFIVSWTDIQYIPYI